MTVVRTSRAVFLGPLKVGGGAPVSVQSMTKTATTDTEATAAQIAELAAAGCEIVRVAVPDSAAAAVLPSLVGSSPVPLVADIHFDHRLALAAIDAGVAGLRINPGNLGNSARYRAVGRAAAAAGTVVRVGVNAGSLARGVLDECDGDTAAAMVLSARRCCALLEESGCHALKVSLKASDVRTTVTAYRRFAAATDYPLHLGVTEAGTPTVGTIKSAIGIGSLLLDGIGDTLRVSLTAAPVQEVRVGFRILAALGKRQRGPEIVSCPTCGRTRIELVPLVTAVEDEVRRLQRAGLDLAGTRIAVMGCAVNGPGEARDADFGIAGGNGWGVLFRRGVVVCRVPESELPAALRSELQALAEENTGAPARCPERRPRRPA